MRHRSIALSIFVACSIASARLCFSEAVPCLTVPHDRPFTVTLQARRVVSVIGDSFVYDLGNETIVIIADDEVFQHFLARVRNGRRDAKIVVTLIPERKSLFNARFQAHPFIHHP